MVTLKDGRPLISWPLASAILGVLFVPSIAAFWTLSATLAQLRGDADTIKSALLQLRGETYTRAEANIQFQRIDGVDAGLDRRIGEAHARLDGLNQGRSYPIERRNEITRSIQSAVRQEPRVDQAQSDRTMRPQ